jgi:hypothetical protein
MISVDSNVEELKRKLTRIEREQLPFARSQAVNRLARQAVADIQDEMKKVFSGPTPYTLRGFYARGGTKSDPSAEILARENAGKGGTPAWKYLTPEAFGGTRAMKRFERALEAHFGGGFTVPGRGAMLNTYGNMTQGQIEKILSALGAAESRAGYSANRTARSARRKGKKIETFFVAHTRDDGRLLGIYRVVGPGHVEPVLVFTRHAPSYRPRLPYDETVAKSVKEHTAQFFGDAMQQALSTAKP